MLRLLFRSLVLLLAIILVVVASVYFRSESILKEVSRPAEFAVSIPDDSASVANGKHIARTRGCFGCHGQMLQGSVFTDQWDWVKRAVAPNLTAYAKNNPPSVIEAAIRHGIGQDGKALYSMPSYNWVHLSDSDVADLIGYLQSLSVEENSLPAPSLGWSARWAIASRKELTAAKVVLLVPELRPDVDADSSLSNGKYLAMTMCIECHGLDLRGEARRGQVIPDLAVVAAYGVEDFDRLLNEGVSKDGRKLRLMSLVAPDRFPYLSETERRDIRLFLQTLATQPVPSPVDWREVN